MKRALSQVGLEQQTTRGLFVIPTATLCKFHRVLCLQNFWEAFSRQTLLLALTKQNMSAAAMLCCFRVPRRESLL